LTLELAGDVVGRADDEVVEAGVLVDIERDLRGAAQMLLGTSRGVVTHVILLPVAPVVVVAWKLVEAFALVDELTELEHEEPRALSIGQQDRETLVLVDHPLELTHVRGVVHRQMVVHRDRQLDDAPEAVRAAGEHGQASGARAVEPTLHELLAAAAVGVARLPARPAVALLADHPLAVELVALWANVAAPVDIEVTRCDGRAIALEPGQVANDILGDRGHVTSVSFGVTSIVPS